MTRPAIEPEVAARTRFTRREVGQTMIEYALLAALISVVAVAVMVLIGPYLQDWFQQVVNAFGLA